MRRRRVRRPAGRHRLWPGTRALAPVRFTGSGAPTAFSLAAFTTTLFAALNVLDGNVIGRNMQRYRHQEFVRFLNLIEAQVPTGKAIRAILDNYPAQTHPKVREWLIRHPRFTFHLRQPRVPGSMPSRVSLPG